MLCLIGLFRLQVKNTQTKSKQHRQKPYAFLLEDQSHQEPKTSNSSRLLPQCDFAGDKQAEHICQVGSLELDVCGFGCFELVFFEGFDMAFLVPSHSKR